MAEVIEFVDEGLGHSSYLVDIGDGRALVVDPPRFPDRHVAAADARGLTIAFTADTHSHADYVSGSPELAARGASFLASKGAHLMVGHRALVSDEEVELGAGVVMRAIATPGHTPDHLAYLVSRSGAPVALFSGGSLMVGTVGRTDLLGPQSQVPLARQLYRSLRDSILTLPDELAVYPTHGAGSFCSAPGANDRTTTIGRERATNPMLAVHSEDEFVARLVAGFGSFPPYFARLPEVNRRGPKVYGHAPALARIQSDDFRRWMDNGAVVVDVRGISDFAGGHIPGALSIALRPVFASWLGWLVEPDRPLLFVLDDGQDRAELVRQCLAVGYERLTGELSGGMAAWRAGGQRESHLELLEPQDVATPIVDVRQREELVTGYVPESLHVELGALRDADLELPAGPLTMMCGHGERAMTAASLLRARGRGDVAVLAGGPGDWSVATGRALEQA